MPIDTKHEDLQSLRIDRTQRVGRGTNGHVVAEGEPAAVEADAEGDGTDEGPGD